MTLAVILVEPIYMANVGYVARAMMNFGLEELFLVNPQGNLELAKPYAAHAGQILERACIVNKLHEALNNMDLVIGTTAKTAKSPKKVTRICIAPNEFAIKCAEFKGKKAIVFGREDIGLRNIEIDLCDILISIPANSIYPTLNIAHAAAIIFYEIARARLNKVKSSNNIIDGKVRETLLRVFHELVIKVKIPDHKIKFTETAFRNIIARSWATHREATLLVGAFRRCVDKLST